MSSFFFRISSIVFKMLLKTDILKEKIELMVPREGDGGVVVFIVCISQE